MSPSDEYDLIDRSLRSSLDDDLYAKHSMALESLFQCRTAIENLAEAMEMLWGRGREAGYAFPTSLPTLISDREECSVDDLVAFLIKTKGQLEP